MADGAAAPAEPGHPPWDQQVWDHEVGDDQVWDGQVWDGQAAPLAQATVPWLHLDGFDGPLDLLVDLAHRQRIDLGRLSIVGLAEQFAGELEGRLGAAPIARRADWLVLAAQLLQLRSRLLSPATPAAAGQAQRDAAQTLAHLEAMSLARGAAQWLDGRAQLGRDVFARPLGASPRAASVMALMDACLTVLRGRDAEPVDAAAAHQIDKPNFWSVADALARVSAQLEANPQGGDLVTFVPRLPKTPDWPLHAKAAVASTLIAGLELARSGELRLEQNSHLDAIDVSRAGEPAPMG